jgi:hypothetical protein
MINKLKEYLAELKALRKDLKAQTVKQIAKKNLRGRAERLGTRWFTEFAPQLPQQAGISNDILERYSQGCARLIALSAPNNLKTSYLDVLDGLTRPFRNELILPAQTSSSPASSLSLLHKILSDLPDPEENEYLQEAISCAQRGFLRAAVVLGWCAAIDRIHRRIEDLGFAKFSVASAQMASQQKGRFKKFNSPQTIGSLGEMREVFDSIVLWVIEGMGMIDSNEHTRLRSCFEMRCHCGHPGDAPITEYNLMSFFSDLNEIVFKNPMFKL